MQTLHNSILMEIPPRTAQLSGASVMRLMPYAKKRMVGPFIFFDYLPKAEFRAGEGLNVAPHPHIGLSTLSYLLEGSILHHDSLGSKQLLLPGDVNWMTAGKGISHSERMPPEADVKTHSLQLLQFWVALPLEHEDCEPNFTHHPKSAIPSFQVDEAEVCLIAGSAFGRSSPVKAYSPLFFMDVKIPEGASFHFNPEEQELAIFLLNGQVRMDDKTLGVDDFIVLEQGSQFEVIASENARLVVLGGEPLQEPRHIYWNFVSSSKEKIERAKDAWRSGAFPQVPGETDVIPLPHD